MQHPYEERFMMHLSPTTILESHIFSFAFLFAVYALNQLYTSLNFSTFLSRWSPSGGDPCAESWEGVACAGPNVTILYATWILPLKVFKKRSKLGFQYFHVPVLSCYRNLTGLSLVGGLTPALENLTALIVL